MTAAPQLRFTFQDYLRVEASSPVKHEFLDGMILAMAGGTPEHAALAAAVTLALGEQLRGKKCRVFSEALRVRVPATQFAGYPDVAVVCGKLELDPEDPNSVVNPVVVVEILSPGTAQYDRGEKLRYYQQISSLAHIVLVSHDQRRIEVWNRLGSTWALSASASGESATLPGIGCTLDVDLIYADPLTAA